MKNSLENVIDQYEQLWRDGDRPPMLGQFLADSLLSMEQRNAVLADLVAIDMEYRWRAAAPDQSLRATTPVIGTLAADEETIADTIGARDFGEIFARMAGARPVD